jgi:hypothetical protein
LYPNFSIFYGAPIISLLIKSAKQDLFMNRSLSPEIKRKRSTLSFNLIDKFLSYTGQLFLGRPNLVVSANACREKK